MRIVNFDEAAQGPGGGRGIMDFGGDDIDAGAASAPGPLPMSMSEIVAAVAVPRLCSMTQHRSRPTGTALDHTSDALS